MLPEGRDSNFGTERMAGKVPEAMLDQVRQGWYVRACPYPLEEMIGRFRGLKAIDLNTPIVAIGSCFAQHLAHWLKVNGYHCLPLPWGVIYNPMNLAQIVRQSFEPETWEAEEPYWIVDGVFRDPYRKADDHSGAYPLGPDESRARECLAAFGRISRSLLEQTRWAVFTLGLTELWRNRHDGKAYFRMPDPQVFDPARHEFHNLSFQEIVDSLLYTVDTITRHNPAVRFLLSVSPIPLSVTFRNHLGPYIATQFSKSTLHAAVLEVMDARDNVHYMPGYEIVRNDPTRHYTRDGRHVKSESVNLIMNIFKYLYVV